MKAKNGLFTSLDEPWGDWAPLRKVREGALRRPHHSKQITTILPKPVNYHQDWLSHPKNTAKARSCRSDDGLVCGAIRIRNVVSTARTNQISGACRLRSLNTRNRPKTPQRTMHHPPTLDTLSGWLVTQKEEVEEAWPWIDWTGSCYNFSSYSPLKQATTKESTKPSSWGWNLLAN